jgi:hypothetical protein
MTYTLIKEHRIFIFKQKEFNILMQSRDTVIDDAAGITHFSDERNDETFVNSIRHLIF